MSKAVAIAARKVEKKRKGGNRCRKVQEDLCRKGREKSETAAKGLIKKKDKEDDCIFWTKLEIRY
jgi:hypothetical protein